MELLRLLGCLLRVGLVEGRGREGEEEDSGCEGCRPFKADCSLRRRVSLGLGEVLGLLFSDDGNLTASGVAREVTVVALLPSVLAFAFDGVFLLSIALLLLSA